MTFGFENDKINEEKLKQAEEVFRKELSNHPRNGRALFGLLKSLEGQKRDTDAFWIRTAYEKAWKYSTIPLSVENL